MLNRAIIATKQEVVITTIYVLVFVSHYQAFSLLLSHVAVCAKLFPIVCMFLVVDV